jgi:hypothetical protein
MNVTALRLSALLSLLFLLLVAFVGCAEERGTSGVLGDSAESTGEPVDGWVAFEAAQRIADDYGWLDPVTLVEVQPDGTWRYFFGEHTVDLDPWSGREACVEVDAAACLADPGSWSEIIEQLRIEDDEYVGTEGIPTPPACSAVCGSDDGLTFAGQEAFSNGSYTGGGSSCAGSDHYQCVEWVDRVHKHYGTTYGSNWTGNAYTGYLGSTGSAAFQKGLVPFAPGTSYDAPLTGDIVVWSGGTYGHVGVITAVGASSATVTDQNRKCDDQSCLLTYSTTSGYTLANGSASGYCGAENMGSFTLAAWERRGWDFSGAFGLTGWSLNQMSYTSGTTSGTASNLSDYIRMTVSGSDPYLVSPSGQAIQAYGTSATWGYRYVKFYMESSCANKTAAVYWKPLGGSFSESYKVNATITGSGWQTVTFNLYSDSDWTGVIDQVRLDPSASGTSGCTVDVAYAWFDR